MPCPWLKNNRCTSPKLDRPSAMVVSERCFQDDPAIYTACEFYTEASRNPGRRGSLSGYMRSGKLREMEKAPFNVMVHALPAPVESGCPYFTLVERGSAYAAYCEALDRFLGRHEVWRCAKHWRTCPIARMHRAVMGEEQE